MDVGVGVGVLVIIDGLADVEVAVGDSVAVGVFVGML